MDQTLDNQSPPKEGPRRALPVISQALSAGRQCMAIELFLSLFLSQASPDAPLPLFSLNYQVWT